MVGPGGATLEIQTVGPGHAAALARFFDVLRTHGVGEWFHPHPLTADAARARATYVGGDLYAVLVEGDEVLGYGMLRGWDEGYQVPSLGIAIRPEVQGQGLGRLMMEFLRAAALRRGAGSIRLRVHPDNVPAVTLYRALGYRLAKEDRGPDLLGYLDLRRR